MGRILGLVGARAGSRRLPGKNMAKLGGRPLVDWTLTAADEAWREGLLCATYLSSDDPQVLARAHTSSAYPLRRPSELAGDLTKDVEWVEHALEQDGGSWDAVMILRPTSPFRQLAEIRQAVELWEQNPEATVRSVRKVSEHPGKMWQIHRDGGWADELNSQDHDGPTQLLKPADLYVQCGAIDIVPVSRIEEGILAPYAIVPLILEMPAALDINDRWDLLAARAIVEHGELEIPERLRPVGQGAGRADGPGR